MYQIFTSLSLGGSPDRPFTHHSPCVCWMYLMNDFSLVLNTCLLCLFQQITTVHEISQECGAWFKPNNSIAWFGLVWIVHRWVKLTLSTLHHNNRSTTMIPTGERNKWKVVCTLLCGLGAILGWHFICETLNRYFQLSCRQVQLEPNKPDSIRPCNDVTCTRSPLRSLLFVDPSASCDLQHLHPISPFCDVQFNPGKKECVHNVEYYDYLEHLISVNTYQINLANEVYCDFLHCRHFYNYHCSTDYNTR